MAHWTRIAAATDCPPGRGLECIAAGRIVALFNVDGTWHAIDGVCPHQGGPLAKGCLEGAMVTCPWHGWRFDVVTGRHAAASALAQKSFPVRVEEGEVFVDLEGGR
jgi:nitrite reductase/ring-hydroxylating ferredoxin subunit